MPVQQQMSSFAKRLGGRVAQANAEHHDKPVDTGNRRLPAGIRDGVARLASMYTKEQTVEDGKTPKGETFFRASAIVLSPAEHDGHKVAGIPTSVTIPMCDVPAKGQRKAKSFNENWYEFQNLFKLLGFTFPEPPVTGPPTSPEAIAQGLRIEQYYFGVMKSLTDPVRMKTNPVYISFSTRGWTPPATPQQPKPEEMVFEQWHGLAEWGGPPDPASGVNVLPPSSVGHQPGPGTPPPSGNGPWSGPGRDAVREVAVAAAGGVPPAVPPTAEPDLADVVTALIEVAMDDPEGATDAGADAAAQLEQMAQAVGWTPEQTAAAQDWAAVGDMALNPPTPEMIPTPTPPPTVGPPSQSTTRATPLDASPAVGSRWLFAKRSKEGEKLKNKNGEPFPPQEVEVVTIDAEAKTCTVRTVKDGKDVVDIRSKKPVAVQFGWLESLPY